MFSNAYGEFMDFLFFEPLDTTFECFSYIKYTKKK